MLIDQEQSLLSLECDISGEYLPDHAETRVHRKRRGGYWWREISAGARVAIVCECERTLKRLLSGCIGDQAQGRVAAHTRSSIVGARVLDCRRHCDEAHRSVVGGWRQR